jgi:SAM-dependent methyltransferase
MATESVKEFYNRQYRSCEERKTACPNSLHDLAKAHRRVKGVLRGFGIKNCSQGAEVLDVGCGLGYYTNALSSTGARVTGIDFSETAIEVARARFPECRFTYAAWHEDIDKEPQFDIIWTVNFSLVNTFDVNFINQRLIAEALRRLKPNGYLVLGWNTDFSGRTIDNYSHWPMRMLRRMRQVCGLSTPIVAEARTLWLSWLIIRAARIFRRSIPIFMVRRKEENA